MMDRGDHHMMDRVHYMMDGVHYMMDRVHHMMDRLYFVMDIFGKVLFYFYMYLPFLQGVSLPLALLSYYLCFEKCTHKQTDGWMNTNFIYTY